MAQHSKLTEDDNITQRDATADLLSDPTFTAPVKRNIIKAVDRLCCAATDIPVGAIERRSAEKRAETEASIKIMEGITAQIIEQMKIDPEYPQRAIRKYGEKILREQINLDKIWRVAKNLLKREKSASSTDQDTDDNGKETISDEFLNGFGEEAKQKTSEEMQDLFGRILAGEIRKPGSYSIKAVKILGEIDQHVATYFRTLCSMSVGNIDLAAGAITSLRVINLSDTPLSSGTLEKYGLSATIIGILQEYGLILDSNFLCWRVPYSPHLIRHQKRAWTVSPLSESEDKNRNLELYGISFSRVGHELSNLVDPEPVPQYTEDLKNFFAGQNLQMIENRTQ